MYQSAAAQLDIVRVGTQEEDAFTVKLHIGPGFFLFGSEDTADHLGHDQLPIPFQILAGDGLNAFH